MPRQILDDPTPKPRRNSDDDKLAQLVEGLEIAREHLDECAITHAHDFYHVTEGYAYAVAQRDATKLDLDRECAQLDKEIREGAVADGEKVTEAVVSSRLKLEPGYDRAYRKYLDASLRADRWRGLQDAFRQRGDMLRILESQRRANAYDGMSPSVASDARDRYHERRERV